MLAVYESNRYYLFMELKAFNPHTWSRSPYLAHRRSVWCHKANDRGSYSRSQPMSGILIVETANANGFYSWAVRRPGEVCSTKKKPWIVCYHSINKVRLAGCW